MGSGGGRPIPRDEEEVKRIMKIKLKNSTKEWRKTLAEKKEAKALLVEELGGEKTRKCKKTLRMLRVAEEKTRNMFTMKYTQKFNHLKEKYKKPIPTEEDPILEGYPGVHWSDTDLSNRPQVRLSKSKINSTKEGSYDGGGGSPIGGVILSDDERSLLELPPNMCTYEILSVHVFECDIEECMAKMRYSKMNDPDSDFSDIKLSKSEQELFADEEASCRNIYNEGVKIFDVRKRNIRDIKNNPRVTLPKALTSHEEATIACVQKL